jgi:hypothetical protein
MRNKDLARKNYLRWLTLARLEGLGLSLREMARQGGMSLRQVRTALKNPAYQEFRDARLQSRVSALDRAFAEDNEQMKTALRELVPAAIHRMEAALNSKDESIALSAASEILDRDERFNKTQQVAVTHALIPSAEIERARELARELRAKQTHETETQSEAAVLPRPN